jgi:hypothetical protein
MPLLQGYSLLLEADLASWRSDHDGIGTALKKALAPSNPIRHLRGALARFISPSSFAPEGIKKAAERVAAAAPINRQIRPSRAASGWRRKLPGADRRTRP